MFTHSVYILALSHALKNLQLFSEGSTSTAAEKKRRESTPSVEEPLNWLGFLLFLSLLLGYSVFGKLSYGVSGELSCVHSIMFLPCSLSRIKAHILRWYIFYTSPNYAKFWAHDMNMKLVWFRSLFKKSLPGLLKLLILYRTSLFHDDDVFGNFVESKDVRNAEGLFPPQIKNCQFCWLL